MIEIRFPDQSVRTYKKGATPLEIAQSISEGLARNVLSASFNGATVEATTPLEIDGAFNCLPGMTMKGKRPFGIPLPIFLHKAFWPCIQKRS